jgi:UDP-N-acetylmuramoyl-tripeptide--D-alanyl-D-alanine ligase
MEIYTNNNKTIINDTYNASPASMKAAMDVLEKAEPRRVCVIGDMSELGDFSEQFHREIGEYADKKGFELIICVGEQAVNMYKYALESANHNQCVLHFRSKSDLEPKISSLINDGDTVLLKASRALRIETII